jgi:hypothetical protein
VQGRGLVVSILDITKPPTGRFRLENLYVMLSRASNWESVAILKQFDDKIFDMLPDQKLIVYNQYLIAQDLATKYTWEETTSTVDVSVI